MQGAVLYGPRDLRFEEREVPKIIKSTDAVISVSATCICGSDLWPYRGIQPIAQPTPMGHEYCGIVEEVGRDVRNIKPGQFVIGSFATSDNTCAICREGYQSSCVQREFMTGAQASLLRVPLADGTLVATNDLPPKELIACLLATSDILGTGWFAADAANVKPGRTVVSAGLKGSHFRRFRASHLAQLASAITPPLWPLRCNAAVTVREFFDANSQFTHDPPAPPIRQPVLRNSVPSISISTD
jgi:threonine dehydrogenase-like Zn-dependent dehydrogenase